MTDGPGPRGGRLGLVPSFVATAGQGVPSRRSMDQATLLLLDTGERAPQLGGLPATQQRVIELCAPGVLSVAEVAAYLQLPGAVTTVVAASLVDSGHLIARQPVPAASRPDISLLEKILDGLKAL